MDEEYDYSQYKFCIVFVLDHSFLQTSVIDVDGYFEDGGEIGGIKIDVPSFVYDTISKTIISEGDSTEESMYGTKELQENLFYVSNAFTELYNIYLKQQEDHCEQNELDDVVLQEAINILQMQVNFWKKKTECSEAMLCYAFTITTSWDYNTKEGLLRPLFVKSGLLHQDDDVYRLNFFTDLDLKFRYMQCERTKGVGIEMKQGRQYVIVSSDFQQAVLVNLSLISAQYPGLKTVDSGYIPQLLKDFDFKIPFGSHSVKLSLSTYLEKFCDSKVVLKNIDRMLEALESIFQRTSMVQYEDGILSFTPFHSIDLEYSYDPKYSEEEFDLMLHNIRQVTVKNVFEDWFQSFAKNFLHGMNTLLQGSDQIKAKYLIMVYTDYITKDDSSNIVFQIIERWIEKYIRDQDSPFKLIEVSPYLSHCYTLTSKAEMVEILLRKQMNDFNIRRDPIILPKNSSNGQYESSSNPVYYINIDLLPTQNKITLTYVDEKSRVKRIENVDCNIQPLDTFFKQSGSSQRPQLYMNNRLKIQLEKMSAEYLIMHSKSDQQKTSSRLIQPEIKTTLGSCFGIKTSKNWLKEIRNFFASSSPHLLEQVMQNVRTDDLFMINNSPCSDDTNSLDTSDPSCIFFIVAYLNNLKTVIEKELKKKFGNDLRDENIWYGVSVDKHLLETVFVSKKKLEKLFYASGILAKDNNLRRAKFCVRGEDILPAIQQTWDLNLKMKSYFVVAQIFPRHVQLTLHQTVKLASPGEDAATIIVEDKIVYFDDVHDELCKKVSENMLSNCHIDYCITHKDKKNTEYDFGSFQAYQNIRQTLKQRILELLKNDSHNVDMNLCTKFNVNKKCSCQMVISLRLVIEKGLQPVIESIVRTIAATLTNYDIFGYYKTDYIFVLGDPFNLSYGSPLYAVYTTILQGAMDDGIHSKRKDAQAFVMKDSLDQLLYLFKSIKPHMFDRFINGTLCQVPSSTYGLCFNFLKDYEFVRLNSNGVIKNFVEGRGHYLIFIEEGKPLSKTGMIFKITSCLGPGEQSSYVDVIKTRQSFRTKLKKYDLLEYTECQRLNAIHSFREHFAYNFILDCKHLNYNYSLELSIKQMSQFQSVYDYLSKYRVLGEPLTLAYI